MCSDQLPGGFEPDPKFPQFTGYESVEYVGPDLMIYDVLLSHYDNGYVEFDCPFSGKHYLPYELYSNLQKIQKFCRVQQLLVAEAHP